MQETRVRPLGREDSLEKGMTIHSSILAWRIPQRSLVGYSPWGCKESDTTERLHLHQSLVWACQVALVVKNQLANAGDTRDLGWEDPLEKEMAPHSSILA